ncbi:MAG TPA: putative dsRNA-binding protein, partial [Limnochordales bacterium]
LRMGRAARSEGLHGQERLLASALEAVMGAIFVDGGWAAAWQAVRQALEGRLERLASPGEANPKGALQEFLAREGLPAPHYRLALVEGEPHRRRFVVEVVVGGTVAGTGSGSSRKRAEQEAARMALSRLAAAEGQAGSGAGPRPGTGAGAGAGAGAGVTPAR